MSKLLVELPSLESVLEAKKSTNWTLGNNLLYKLCEENPYHRNADDIVSKFWLIGRSYSAAVERRRTSEETPLKSYENFYEHRLVKAIQDANFDKKFNILTNLDYPTVSNINSIVEIHHYLTETLYSITNQRKISLASKYLHFHFHNLFFLYDKRAHDSLRIYVKNWSSNRMSESDKYNKTYYKFCLGMIALRAKINSAYGHELTPRELDRLLLAPKKE